MHSAGMRGRAFAQPRWTVFTLTPATETQSLVLWITQLPTAADGGFRLELTEIALS